ncbi:uncharacterized protein LOC120009719 [Tripterygium wilfordii]|uniref:uncharacterized protein LOC120009719 n=1 Tax=Tripterygium wilfordii TaxID=458696 RepID=UPI0018F800C7|nr:uncharacterized protein LOC120009719 [Tripterygium wilfordii]
MGSTKGARWTFPEEILMNFAKENFHKEEGRFAFAIVIYGTVIFPCAGGNIDRGVIKMVNHVKHQATPVPAILCETFRSLNHCRVSTEGRFIGCAQLLGIWLISHLKYDKTVGAPFVQFQKDDCQLRDPISDFEKARLQPLKPSMEKWSCFLSSLDEKKVYMRALWHKTDGLIYRCGDFDWVPLIGPWGITSQAPAMFLQQIGGNPCRPVTFQLKEFEFSLEEEKAKALVRKIVEAWSAPQGVRKGPRNIYGTVQYKAWHAKRGKSYTDYDMSDEGRRKGKGKLGGGDNGEEKHSQENEAILKEVIEEEDEDGRVSYPDFVPDRGEEVMVEEEIQEMDGDLQMEDTSSDDEMVRGPSGYPDKEAKIMWKMLQTMTEKYKKYKGKFRRMKAEFVKSKKMKLQEDLQMEKERGNLQEEYTKMKEQVRSMKGELQEARKEITQMKGTIVTLEELSYNAKKEIVDKVDKLKRNKVEINSLKEQMEYAISESQKFQKLYEADEDFIQQKEAEVEELNQQNDFLHDELNEFQQKQQGIEDKIKLIMSRALQLSEWAHSYEKRKNHK